MQPFFIFDLDGTLSDPAVGVLRSINHALSGFGYPEIEESRISECIGPPIDQSFVRLTGSNDRDHVASLVARYRERYSTAGYAENVLYPGIPEALAGLEKSGVRMGVCTSKRVDFAERILVMFELRHHFEFVSGGEDGASKTEHLRSLLDGRQAPAHAVMIGDRAVDMAAGRVNGLVTAGVLWGHGGRDELQSAGADHLVFQPEELPGLPLILRPS